MPSPTIPASSQRQEPAPKLMSMQMQDRSLQALNYCFLMCDYLLLNTQFDLSKKVNEARLLDRGQLEEFKARVKELNPGEMLELDLDECILFVTVIEIACKCFVSDVMDDMRVYFTAAFGLTESRFAHFRRFFLRLALLLTSPVREHLKELPPFREKISRVDNLEFDTD